MIVLREKIINGKLFRLVQNSIIEEPVEAIVNPANERLAHGGGVAGLIARSGGPQIQRESDRRAPVATGSATHTTAGQLPFRCIIHAVGPIWRGGQYGEERLLAAAVRSALELADRLGIRSLSLPAISTGIFNYPLEPALRTIVTEIVKCMATATSLEEIRLCEYAADKARAMLKIIKARGLAGT